MQEIIRRQLKNDMSDETGRHLTLPSNGSKRSDPLPFAMQVTRMMGFAVYLTVSSLLLLEATLQAGSIYIWLTHRWQTTKSSSGLGRTILCVGDSWTYGVASSDVSKKSYPAQLQEVLQGELPGESWKVINRGVPGQNSSDMLKKLPDQLSKYRPEWVIILIGMNDSWTHPDLLQMTDDGSFIDETAFRWTWRTGRLIDWVFRKIMAKPIATDGEANDDGKLQATAKSQNDVPSVGRVSKTVDIHGSTELRPEKRSLRRWLQPFGNTAGNRVSQTNRPTEPDVQTELRQARTAMAESNFSAAVRHAKNVLAIRPGDHEAFSILANAQYRAMETVGDELRKGWKALSKCDLNDALRHAGNVTAINADETDALRLLAVAHHWLGNTDQANAYLVQVRKAFEIDANENSAAALLLILDELGRQKERRQRAQKFVLAYPTNAIMWAIYAKVCDLDRNQAAAERAIDRVFELDCKPWMLAVRTKIYARGDNPEQAVRSVILFYLMTHDEDQASSQLRNIRWRIAPELYASVLAATTCTNEERQALERIGRVSPYKPIFDRRFEAVAHVFEAHLSQAVTLCLEHQAQPVILNYALDHEPMQVVRRKVAGKYEVGFVNVRARLRAASRNGSKWHEYFSAEGHFNDMGYAAVARFVADHLMVRCQEKMTK